MNWMLGPQFRNDPNQVWNPKRLFVGLELPSSCKLALLALDPHLTGLRWLLEEQLHLTLSFIGDVQAPAEVGLRGALERCGCRLFFCRCAASVSSSRAAGHWWSGRVWGRGILIFL